MLALSVTNGKRVGFLILKRKGGKTHRRNLNNYDTITTMSTKQTQTNQFNVLIPITVKPHPDKYEEKVARILAQKFQSDILFVPRRANRTPDIQIVRTKQYWEIKNIRGNSKKTIEDNLRKAAKQSDRVVISLLRTKMTATQASSRIKHYLSQARGNIKHVILITKKDKCIDFGI